MRWVGSKFWWEGRPFRVRTYYRFLVLGEGLRDDLFGRGDSVYENLGEIDPKLSVRFKCFEISGDGEFDDSPPVALIT